MPILASSTLSNAPLGVNFQLMKGFLSTARKRLPFFNGTLPGQLMKNGSASSVRWERVENLAPNTTPLAQPAGTVAAFFGRDTSLPSMTNVTAAMAKYGDGVLLTEEVDVYQMNPIAARYMDILGGQCGESLNLLMEAIYRGFTNVRFCNGSTGGTADSNVSSIINLADIRWAHNFLNRNSAMKFTTAGYGSQNIGTAPIRSSYYGICHVDTEEDIRNLSGFISVEQYGGYMETLPHEFGSVGGVRWSSTEIIPISTNASTFSAAVDTFRGSSAAAHDVYSVYIYGKEAVGSVGLGNQYATTQAEMFDPARPPAVEFITKAKGTIGTDLYNEFSAMTWKAWFAGAILNQNWGVRLRTLATQL